MSSRSTSPLSTTSSSSSSETIESLEDLIVAIKDFLGPTSGLDSKEVDHDVLVRMMQSYQSRAADWAKYAFADPSRNYTRNFVDDTNAKSNILVVVWVSLVDRVDSVFCC